MDVAEEAFLRLGGRKGPPYATHAARRAVLRGHILVLQAEDRIPQPREDGVPLGVPRSPGLLMGHAVHLHGENLCVTPRWLGLCDRLDVNLSTVLAQYAAPVRSVATLGSMN